MVCRPQYTPGVTGFVGMGNEPIQRCAQKKSLKFCAVWKLKLQPCQSDVQTVKVRRVRIVDGPFNDFRGTVAEIDMDRTKVRVMVNFFGRETPVELDFLASGKNRNDGG